MSGVFLSYSRADRELAERVVGSLRAIGVDVWWDQDMPGVDWQQELERQITELTALIVLWSPTSKNSEYVRDEARLALSSHKLVNALSGVSAPPFPFDRINGLPIDGWDGRATHGGWSRLVATLEEHLVRSGATKPGELIDALSRREGVVTAAEAAVTAAEEAYQDAKAREGDCRTASEAAREALRAADAQLQRVAEMHVSPAILRAAQAEFDNARAAAEAADAERKVAASGLSTASRALTRAKAELDRLFERAPPSTKSFDDPAPVESVRREPTTAPAVDPTPVALADSAPALEPRAQTAPAQPPAVVAPSLAASVAVADPEPSPAPPAPPPPSPAPSPRRSGTPWVIGAVAAVGVLSVVGLVALISKPEPSLSNTAQSNAVDSYAAAKPATGNDATSNAVAPASSSAPMDVATAKANASAAEDRKDLASAAYWWRIAANQGDAQAEYKIGLAYYMGYGVSVDDPVAVGWFQKAADQNQPDAEDWLGFAYENGYGVDKDMSMARTWYGRAAAAGKQSAQKWLDDHPADSSSSG